MNVATAPAPAPALRATRMAMTVEPTDPVCQCGHGRSVHDDCACLACSAALRLGRRCPAGACCVGFLEVGRVA